MLTLAARRVAFMTHEQLRLLNTPWPCRRRLLSAPLPAATSLWVRHSTSLWRAVPLYQKDADGRYRIKKEMPKPTMPTRVEGCTSGARKKLFKHGCVTTHTPTSASATQVNLPSVPASSCRTATSFRGSASRTTSFSSFGAPRSASTRNRARATPHRSRAWQVREWDAMMAQRKREGKPEWFCCPRW